MAADQRLPTMAIIPTTNEAGLPELHGQRLVWALRTGQDAGADSGTAVEGFAGGDAGQDRGRAAGRHRHNTGQARTGNASRAASAPRETDRTVDADYQSIGRFGELMDVAGGIFGGRHDTGK